MQMPDVLTTLRDDQHNVTYRVLAYRKLSRDEMIHSVRLYHSQPKIRRRKTSIRNQVITIISVLGATPNL